MKLTERTSAALAWIDEQLAICNAATKGPWNDGWELQGVTCDWQVKIPNSHAVVATEVGFSEGTAVAITDKSEDAAFITAARTGYPAMLEGMKIAIEWLLKQYKCGEHFENEYAKAFTGNQLFALLTKIESLQ